MMTEIKTAAHTRVVAVRMRNNCFVYRLPGIYIKIAPDAVKSLVGKFDHCLIYRFHQAVYLADYIQFFVLEIVEGLGALVENWLYIEFCEQHMFFVAQAGTQVIIMRVQ